jgi:Flp pilus assembly protein TadD
MRILWFLALAMALAACQQTYAPPLAAPSGQVQQWLRQADVAQAMGNTDEAVSYYRKAADVAAGARAHLALADIYRTQGNQQQALNMLQAAYKRQPQLGVVQEEYARQLLLMGETQQARQIAEQALTDHPTNVRLLNVLGLAEDRAGKHKAAQGWYDKAMKAASGVREREYTANNLALSYIASGRYDTALVLLEKQMPFAQDKPALRQVMALAYGAKGQTDKAYELGLMEVGVEQMQQNLRFYEQLRAGKVNTAVLFAAAPQQ